MDLTRREVAEIRNALIDAFADPEPSPGRRRDGLRAALADRVSAADVAAAAAAVRAVFNGECPDRAAAKARYAQASFVQEIQVCRESMREMDEIADCQTAWSARPRGQRRIDDLLACGRRVES